MFEASVDRHQSDQGAEDGSPFFVLYYPKLKGNKASKVFVVKWLGASALYNVS